MPSPPASSRADREALPPEVPRAHAPPPALSPAQSAPVGLGIQGIRSGFARLAERGLLLVLGVVSAAILARLLTPADFGVVAMVSVLSAFVESLRHFGLPLAIVHQRDLSEAETNAVFWRGVYLNGLASGAMACAAPALAWLFDEPAVLKPTLAIAAALFVLSLGAHHAALLMRDMRFGTVSAISAGATALGMAVGVAAAAAGAGYWALIAQTSTHFGTQTAAHWLACGWRPGWPATSNDTALSRYGREWSGASVLNYLGRNADRVVIGATAGAGPLGLYDNAFRWSLFPVQQVFKPLEEVAVSGLSRARRDEAAFRGYVYRSALPVLALTLPALTFVVIAADPVVRVLLGDQWLGAIPLVRWLSAAGLLRCLTRVARWLFLAEGRTRQQLVWAFVQAPLLAGAVAFGVQWGIEGVAIAFFAASAALFLPEMGVALYGSHLRLADLVRAAWRPSVASLSAAVAVLAAGVLGAPSEVGVRLAADAFVFGTAYLAVWIALPGGLDSAREVTSLVSRLRRDAPLPPSS